MTEKIRKIEDLFEDYTLGTNNDSHGFVNYDILFPVAIPDVLDIKAGKRKYLGYVPQFNIDIESKRIIYTVQLLGHTKNFAMLDIYRKLGGHVYEFIHKVKTNDYIFGFTSIDFDQIDTNIGKYLNGNTNIQKSLCLLQILLTLSDLIHSHDYMDADNFPKIHYNTYIYKISNKQNVLDFCRRKKIPIIKFDCANIFLGIWALLTDTFKIENTYIKKPSLLISENNTKYMFLSVLPKGIFNGQYWQYFGYQDLTEKPFRKGHNIITGSRNVLKFLEILIPLFLHYNEFKFLQDYQYWLDTTDIDDISRFHMDFLV